MSADKDGIVSIPETEQKMRGEWLAFERVEVDQSGWPLRGRLVAHSPDRDAVDGALLRLRPLDSYVVYAGPCEIEAFLL